MADKKKLKHETIGQIRYYWNWALFARKFEAEVDASPEVVADLFNDIGLAPSGILNFRTRTANITTEAEGDIYDFDLRMKHIHRGMRYTSVKATGSIIYSEGYDATIVRGDIRLGWFYSVSMLVAVLSLIIGIVISVEFLPMLVFTLPYIAFILWQLRRDYRTLTHLIHDQINQAQRAQIDHADGSGDVDLHMLSDDEPSEFTFNG